MSRDVQLLIACLCVFVLASAGGGSWLPDVIAPSKPDAATYVHEKDDSQLVPAVQSAINKLNRIEGFTASVFEDDTTDGAGQTPDQYVVPAEAAREDGKPCVVFTAGDEVFRVIPVTDDTTEAEVLEVVR